MPLSIIMRANVLLLSDYTQIRRFFGILFGEFYINVINNAGDSAISRI